jgi:hypothetical protein
VLAGFHDSMTTYYLRPRRKKKSRRKTKRIKPKNPSAIHFTPDFENTST